MQYGVCGGLEMAPVALACGYDYLECTVEAALKPSEPEPVFEDVLRAIEKCPLSIPALNCLVPARLKLTGPQVDAAAIRAHVETVCRRARRAGVHILVFGSGGARRTPDGWDHLEAWSQLVTFGRLLAAQAAEHELVAVVEPLNRRETDQITTVSEAAALVRAVNHPALRLLVDGYHWLLDGDSAGDVVANAGLLAHAHVATVPNRLPPGAETCPLPLFFETLARAGYHGRMTFEGNLADPERRLPAALALMRRLEQDAARDAE